jgi:hypothetical protein
MLARMDERGARGELYGAALDEFVETRARLAAALASGGRKAEAQALKKVRRPPPSAWATNQVVRGARAEVNAFLAASDRLRGSQGALVAGRGDRGVYQADAEELRRATSDLAEAARQILAALGRPDDRAIADRVLANARAAALTDAARAALLTGELGADLDAGGDAFGGLLGAGLTSAAAPPPAPPVPPVPPRDHDERRARERAEQRDRERAEARREEEAARERASAAEAAAAHARTALDDARRRVDDAQRAARDAESALRQAEAALRGAQREATEAETRAGRATRRREALEG